MTIAMAETIVAVLGVYAAIGVAFALAFIVFGAGRIDPSARGMPVQARMIIFPGVAALWPLVLVKLFAQREPPVS
jgi:hypothetical protein